MYVLVTKKNTDGTLKVLEENNYYPFGLKHSGYTSNTKGNQNYKYKYNGKELQDELGLNWHDYGWRNYDASVGRWLTPDPLFNDLITSIDFNQVKGDEIDMLEAFANKAEVGNGVFNPNNFNPYSYGYNNPISFSDPDGRCPICIGAGIGAAIEGGTQIYK